ncbi:polysaccharide biosynthesis protein [Candidatus Altiarchaeota archaeon]
MKDFFKGKDILVTGGCGSIGSEIVRELLDYNVKRIRVFDNDESGQFHLEHEVKHKGKTRFLMGDIRDKKRLEWAMEGVDIVFHAAALKHVPLCEYNPFEAVKTNVIGTQNIVEVARDCKVKKVLAISTDKAVNPINTMGATKLLSEKLILSGFIGDSKTRFSCVRFGNVLNSIGSVIPIFKNQIINGGPVTLTSEDMTRFYMSMQEAVSHVLDSMTVMKGNEIFILKMRALKIIDLAEVMISELAPKYGYTQADVKTKMIGRRHGEKLHELLLTHEETYYLMESKDMYVLEPGVYTPHYIVDDKGPKTKIKEYTSKNGDLLTKEEIKELLYNEGII